VVLKSRNLVHGEIKSIEHKTFESDMADLTKQELDRGLKYFESFDGFFKTGLFKSVCQNLDLSAFGLPEPELAYREAASHCHEWRTWEFSHPAVAKALLETGLAVMREYTEKSSKPVFLRNYQVLCRRVMAGESIDNPIPKAIPSHIPKPASPETAKLHMEQLKGLFA